jgi:hypothetical protein
MADTFTANLGLRLMAYGDGAPGSGTPTWDTLLNAVISALDGLGALGPLGVALTENPSTSLNIKVAAGSFRKGDGSLITYAGTSSQAMTASQPNYVYLDDVGTLHVNITGFPPNCVRLAVVTAGASTITSIADARIPWPLVGAGTPTIAAGSGAGTGPTVSISGTDRSGSITVTTGTSPAASAVIATVTFGQPFGVAPSGVLISSANAATAALSAAGIAWGDTLTTTTWALNSGSSALAASTTYKWYYRVEG